MICVSSPFLYKSTKSVSWKYDAIAYVQGENMENKPLVISEPTITNIVQPGRMTRIGRVFSPTQAHKKSDESLEKSKRNEFVVSDKGKSSPKKATSQVEAR